MQIQLLLCTSIILTACAPATPQVRLFEPLPQGIDTPIYMTAARQKDTIKQALRNAGFHIVDQLEDSTHLMRVTIGADQGSEPCGTLNNVRFQLRITQRNVAEATAKGWTGSCQPNVFDEVSQAMAKALRTP